ncbi:putative RNA methyltransferase [uncultured Tessaracoccus sp.]|uniref:putative RNA methyltransferase n=1 Tax=uncultured Tessaracoccus sp. TaxID=905023 RepID=UPI0025DDB332|nr:methyltransferase domain-containing protein [uncultured Tessaracoccus sp.]
MAGWLRCPVCAEGLTLDGRTLGCVAGHRFDVARQGYVNLLGHAAPPNADTPAMLDARARFLATRWYAPITDEVRRAVAGCGRVLEVGAGTAHHLAHALDDDAVGLATDVSVAACRRAARAHPRVAAVVADTWTGLPLGDGVVDAVVCLFAPRNLTEFRRVLAPGGRIVVCVPNAGHLAELRRAAGLLDVPPGKAEELAGQLEGTVGAQRVRFAMDLDEAATRDLVAMGPNAFHGRRAPGAVRTTADVTICVGR